MMDDNNTLIVAASAFLVMSCAYVQLMKKKKAKRRWWAVSLHRSRESYGGTHLLADLLKEPSGKFENFCRMSSEDFENLLQRCGPLISNKDTRWRRAIPAKERLALTLRFLATGDSFRSLQYVFKISPQVISYIVPEVCSAIVKVLHNMIQIPSSEDEWKKVAQQFEAVWNFPHCTGAIDGKHITMQSPVNSGSDFYSYKQYFSIILMALVDADYCFLFADCGTQGRLSDGAVFRNTELFMKIEMDLLNFPPDKPLPGGNRSIPYVFVGDDAFGLSKRIMKPYPGMHPKGSKERVFNYRLSRARRIVENVFGIMSSVFRVLRKPMLLEPEKASLVTITCAVLHNYLRKSRTSRSYYTPPGALDSEENGQNIPGSWRQEQGDKSGLLPLRNIPRNSAIEVRAIRDEFANYFMTTGKVIWQDEYC